MTLSRGIASNGLVRQFTASVCRQNRRRICYAAVSEGVSLVRVRRSNPLAPDVLVAGRAEPE